MFRATMLRRRATRWPCGPETAAIFHPQHMGRFRIGAQAHVEPREPETDDRIAAPMPSTPLHSDPRTPGLVAAFAALSALGALALANGGLDRPIFAAINGFAARDLPRGLPSDLTILGHGLVAVMLLAPFLGSNPRVLAAGILAAPLAGLFSWAGKTTFGRPRPAAALGASHIHIEGQTLAAHNSFPSGHSITIFLVATVLILACRPTRTRPALAGAMLGAALVAASSRVMVGAHWPSDVLGGAALGVVAGGFGVWASRRFPARSNRARGALGIVVLACAAALAITDTGYPLAQPLQWIAVAVGGVMGLWAIARSMCAGRPRCG